MYPPFAVSLSAIHADISDNEGEFGEDFSFMFGDTSDSGETIFDFANSIARYDEGTTKLRFCPSFNEATAIPITSPLRFTTGPPLLLVILER